jgi:hypothetical protein
MKSLFIAMLALFLSSMACYAQRTFTFKIDQQVYTLSEQNLNELFGSAYNVMIEKKWTDNNHFDLWSASFNDWKNQCVSGYWIYETLGNRVSNSSFDGPVSEIYLGWDKGHKPAKGNPHKLNNIARRMQTINQTLSREVIYFLTGKVIVN